MQHIPIDVHGGQSDGNGDVPGFLANGECTGNSDKLDALGPWRSVGTKPRGRNRYLRKCCASKTPMAELLPSGRNMAGSELCKLGTALVRNGDVHTYIRANHGGKRLLGAGTAVGCRAACTYVRMAHVIQNAQFWHNFCVGNTQF